MVEVKGLYYQLQRAIHTYVSEVGILLPPQRIFYFPQEVMFVIFSVIILYIWGYPDLQGGP